jgi:hypothetical protein
MMDSFYVARQLAELAPRQELLVLEDGFDLPTEGAVQLELVLLEVLGLVHEPMACEELWA